MTTKRDGLVISFRKALARRSLALEFNSWLKDANGTDRLEALCADPANEVVDKSGLIEAFVERKRTPKKDLTKTHIRTGLKMLVLERFLEPAIASVALCFSYHSFRVIGVADLQRLAQALLGSPVQRWNTPEKRIWFASCVTEYESSWKFADGKHRCGLVQQSPLGKRKFDNANRGARPSQPLGLPPVACDGADRGCDDQVGTAISMHSRSWSQHPEQPHATGSRVEALQAPTLAAASLECAGQPFAREERGLQADSSSLMALRDIQASNQLENSHYDAPQASIFDTTQRNFNFEQDFVENSSNCEQIFSFDSFNFEQDFEKNYSEPTNFNFEQDFVGNRSNFGINTSACETISRQNFHPESNMPCSTLLPT